MPLFWLSLAFLAGILIAAELRLPAAAWLALAGLSLFVPLVSHLLRGRLSFSGLGAIRSSRCLAAIKQVLSGLSSSLAPMPGWLLPLFVTLGAARYAIAQPDFTPEDIGWYNDGPLPVEVRGLLVEPPDERDGFTLLKVRAEELRLGWEGQPFPVHGLLLVRLEGAGDWRYGDRLLLEGRLATPFESEDFSYRDYLARQGVYSYLEQAQAVRLESGRGNPVWAAIYAFKERALQVVYRLWPDPEASLLAGILLGVESGIPEEVEQAFQDTGTSHIIAISG